MGGTPPRSGSGASTFEYAVMLGIVLMALLLLSISLLDGARAKPNLVDGCPPDRTVPCVDEGLG